MKLVVASLYVNLSLLLEKHEFQVSISMCYGLVSCILYMFGLVTMQGRHGVGYGVSKEVRNVRVIAVIPPILRKTWLLLGDCFRA